MSSAEIISIVSLVLPRVIKFTANYFGMSSNAPHQIKRLRKILEDLQNKSVIRKANPQSLERINQLINDCNDLLEKTMRQSRRGSLAWEIFWSNDVEAKLENLVNMLHMEAYSAIAMVGLELEPPEAESRSRSASPVEPAPTFHRPEGKLAYPKLPSGTKNLHVILHLENDQGRPIVEPLSLSAVTVADRDDNNRLIRCENDPVNEEEKIWVSHTMQRQRILFMDDSIEDLDVQFLDPHFIQVRYKSVGYKVYNAVARYEFRTRADRENFLVQLRERALLDSFHAQRVTHRGILVAQLTAVRFWEKSADSVPSSNHVHGVTVSFLGRNQIQYEWLLKDFERHPNVERGNQQDKVILFNHADGKKTEFALGVEEDHDDSGSDGPPRRKKKRRRSLLEVLQRRRSEFHDDDAPPRPADRFKAVFEANHPLTSPLRPVRPQVTIITTEAPRETHAAEAARETHLAESARETHTVEAARETHAAEVARDLDAVEVARHTDTIGCIHETRATGDTLETGTAGAIQEPTAAEARRETAVSEETQKMGNAGSVQKSTAAREPNEADTDEYQLEMDVRDTYLQFSRYTIPREDSTSSNSGGAIRSGNTLQQRPVSPNTR